MRAPLRPCRGPRCTHLTRGRYCPTCAPAQARAKHQAYDQTRGTATARGYDARWQKARAAYLARHPLCVECERQGRVTAATVVDHIVPHKGDQRLFWDQANWQSRCKPCHDTKTASEDGGFGNLPKKG